MLTMNIANTNGQQMSNKLLLKWNNQKLFVFHRVDALREAFP